MTNRTKIQEIPGALLPPPNPIPLDKRSLEELSATPEWRQLSPQLKQIVSAYIASGCTSLNAVVAAHMPSWDPERVQQAVDTMLARGDVQDVLVLQSGKSLEH